MTKKVIITNNILMYPYHRSIEMSFTILN